LRKSRHVLAGLAARHTLTERPQTGRMRAGLSVQRAIELDKDRIPEPTMALNKLKIKPVSTCVLLVRPADHQLGPMLAFTGHTRKRQQTDLVATALEAEGI
jgi:hypothetical protein